MKPDDANPDRAQTSTPLLALAAPRPGRRRGRLAAAALAALLPAGCAADRKAPTEIVPITAPASCTVARVSDGDTIRCAEFSEAVRLVEIDAPETGQGAPGAAATARLESLVSGRTLRLEPDIEKKDQFGRWLLYAWAGDQMINEEMVRSGYAVVLIFPPNQKYESRMRAAEADARANRRGLWATDGFRCLPADFRAGRCG